MEYTDLFKEISSVSYPGRGIVIGRSEDGKNAVIAYFIMGRSGNSRNRIFLEDDEGIRTKAFDESKLTDPSLIIYHPVRVLEGCTIVTNGDQTDTVFVGMKEGKTFEESLRGREFEPDGPNFTPRISGCVWTGSKGFSYCLSILKSDNGDDSQCNRYTFSYEGKCFGKGHYIHTYLGDGDPLPSFEGEPTPVIIKGGIEEFTDGIWEALDADNKVSLFTRFISLETGRYESRIINKLK
ncbi:MAG: IMP cyclohydrolase [Lachnospiraceae bacterium]|nr:IMP cyclohydrolase [Lachnospiraceae bacterium]